MIEQPNLELLRFTPKNFVFTIYISAKSLSFMLTLLKCVSSILTSSKTASLRFTFENFAPPRFTSSKRSSAGCHKRSRPSCLLQAQKCCCYLTYQNLRENIIQTFKVIHLYALLTRATLLVLLSVSLLLELSSYLDRQTEEVDESC